MSCEKKADSKLLVEAPSSDTKQPAPPSKAELAAKKKTIEKQRSAAFKYVLRYPKKECGSFLFGMFCLLLGSAGDFVVPLYIGWVIDALENDEMELI